MTGYFRLGWVFPKDDKKLLRESHPIDILILLNRRLSIISSKESDCNYQLLVLTNNNSDQFTDSQVFPLTT
jgi:hypothetical protein